MGIGIPEDNTLLNISGGTLIVQAGVGENTSVTGGDGIDSNGDITISGGTVIVFGSEGGADSALDYDGKPASLAAPWLHLAPQGWRSRLNRMTATLF